MACTCLFRSSSSCRCGKYLGLSRLARWTAALRGVGLGLWGLGVAATAGCADTKPSIEYSAAQLLGMWNESMRGLADRHAGCPYERDLPFNYKGGACYPLKCKNSGDEVSLLRKADGTVYKCDSGCNGGCSSVAHF